MQRYWRLTMLLAGLYVAACDVQVESDLNTITANATETEARQLMALESQWSDMFGAGDIDGITALLAEDTVLLAPGSKPLVGMANVRQATVDMLAASDVDVSWVSTEARVAPGGDMAFDYGTATTVLPDGSTSEGAYLVVWVREDGTWKIAADMFH